MRRFKEPVVAAPPTGVRIRTRIHMTDSETAAMTAIGTFLGTLYRAELADRIRLGRIDRRSQVGWRTERKRQITAKSSSRWAGAITRTVEDQYQLGMRAVAANIANLRAAVALLEKRCALPLVRLAKGLPLAI
jgi:hypothetical protein